MKNSRPIGLAVVILAFSFFFSTMSPYFFNLDNMRNILDQSSLNITVGLGMALVIASGGIDLSVGSATALIGVLIAPLLKLGVDPYLVCSFAILLGILTGLWNSTIVVFLRVNPFIGTLASMSLMSGLALIATKGIPVYGFPKEFALIGRGRVLEIPISVLICGLLFLILSFLFFKTVAGIYTLALGSNEDALKRCGVSVRRWRTGLYCLCGVCSAIASILITSRLNSAEPLAGTMMEMDAIATAVLGGTAITGGSTSLSGTVLAGVLLAMVKNGLTMLGISSYYQSFSVGAIVLVSVILSERTMRAENKNGR